MILNKNKHRRHISWVLLPYFALFFLISGIAGAATLDVNTTADEFDGINCSLRNAIQSANLGADFGGCVASGTYGTDTINLQADNYPLTIDPSAPDNPNTDGDLDICANVTLNGAGSGQTIIRAAFDTSMDPNNSDRVIQIWDEINDPPCTGDMPFIGGTPVAVLNGVTIQDGQPNSLGTFQGFFGGGGILNQGDMTLNDSEVRNNLAINQAETDQLVFGGGILNFGTARINRSNIHDNVARSTSFNISPFFFALGGGIATAGADISTPFILEITDSNINRNTVDNGSGGGIATFGAGGQITNPVLILRSAVFDNDVIGDLGPSPGNPDFGSGGGIAHRQIITDPGTVATFLFVDSTLSGNTAVKDGGGLLDAVEAVGPGSGVQILSSTVAFNSAAMSGGGIKRHRILDMTTLRVMNTILANNTAPLGPDCNSDDLAEPLTSEGYNLIRDQTDCTINGPGTGDQPAGTDPLLGALANNGGLTPTHALLVGSLAIDMARPEGDGGCVDDLDNPTALPFDQRNNPFARVVAGVIGGTPRCDIGAFEFVPPSPSPTPVPVIPALCIFGDGFGFSDQTGAPDCGCALQKGNLGVSSKAGGLALCFLALTAVLIGYRRGKAL